MPFTPTEALATIEPVNDICKEILKSGVENGTELAHKIQNMGEAVTALHGVYTDSTKAHMEEKKALEDKVNQKQDTIVKLYDELYLTEGTKTVKDLYQEQNAKSKEKVDPMAVLVEAGKKLKS